MGPAIPVFDTKTQSCEKTDNPDTNARAFRDSTGTVHLISTHSIARAMVGPSLHDLKRDCRVIYRSPQDPDPSHFQDNNWLTSFYTEDGKHIAVLVHSEYDSWTVPGKCPDASRGWQYLAHCWWNTITFASSGDGGFSFAEPAPPGNLVAAMPYRFDPVQQTNAVGFNGPTNIVKSGGYYYAMINDWGYREQKYGPCLIRTDRLFDPASWRAWNGADFSVRFADPYRAEIAKPADHVCEPVMPGVAYSLVRHGPDGPFVATQFTPDKRYGPPGLYVLASADLIHWSKPSLVVTTADLLAGEPAGKWSYDYFALIDPASTDRNFTTVTDRPDVYYVRFNNNDPPYARTLMRRPMTLRAG